jgi:uncharacterized protein YndB with AHSA1/START domain
VIVRREATLPATPDEIWRVISDPARLPAWWPGVARVEEADARAWTKVFSSPQGKTVRADYTLVESEPTTRVVWRQEVEESPFERILTSATTEIVLGAGDGGTRVTIELDQRPRGWARFAPMQFRAAGARQVQGALDGLAALFGVGEPA